MELLGRHSAWVEVYSIDEAFLGLAGTPDQITTRARQVRETVRRHVGIPVSVGIAPTKTLAKVANHAAKAHPDMGGVSNLDYLLPSQLTHLLDTLPVTEVWGVARRLAARLGELGVSTARQLRDADPVTIRRRFSVVLQRTLYELRGTPCIPLEQDTTNRDQLMYSRMFSTPISDPTTLRQVLSIYGQRAATRLRKQHLVAGTMMVTAATSPHTTSRYTSHTVPVRFPTPTDDPATISTAAITALTPRLDPEARYVRAGIILTNLTTPAPTLDGFDQTPHLGALLDAITTRHGGGTIGLGHGGIRQAPAWAMRRDMLSPRATTEWGELALVKAG
jgi:DNA polymerase V